MSRGINKVIIVGNLGKDPEVKYTADGKAITNITVATSGSWKDKNTGQKNERTEWHRVCFFNKLAETAGQYLKKGYQVYIEGSLRTRKWQDQSGQDRYTTEIVAREMEMLGVKANGSATDSDRTYVHNSKTGQYISSGSGGGSNANSYHAQPAKAEPNDLDDDIPF